MICTVVLLLGVSVFFLNSYSASAASGTACAQVRVSGRIERTLSLEEDCELSLSNNGVDLEICVSEGRVRFSSSSCPDRICVDTGWLDAAHPVAACVPADVTLRLAGLDGQVDVVLR